MPDGELEPTTQRLNKQLRNTREIFLFYHDLGFGRDLGFGDRELEYSDEDELDDDIHCGQCEVKPAKIRGPRVIEESCVSQNELIKCLIDHVVRLDYYKNTAILVDLPSAKIQSLKQLLEDEIPVASVDEWSPDESGEGHVCLDSVRRFKGLEAKNVIVVVSERSDPEILYSAMSRVISHLEAINFNYYN